MRHLLLPLLASCFAAACSGSATSTGPGAGVVGTSVQRDVHPDVAPGAGATLVSGNTDFAFALYPAVAATGAPGNAFYSPYSVSLALAMTYAGAAANTATQMATALDFTLPSAQLHPAFDALDLAIEATPPNATGDDGNPFAINIADSLWGSGSITFQTPFIDTLASDYGAEVHTVDFANGPAAVGDINGWVSQKTNGKIPKLLSPLSVNQETKFVLVNAVYFNASWASSFDAGETLPLSFTRSDGSTVIAQMMSSNGGAAQGYAKGSNWQAVELPYSGGTTSMVVVLPDAGAYAAVEQQLSPSFYASVTSALTNDYVVDLAFPKFTIHGSTISLVPRLKELGMTDAFSSDLANFSGIASGEIFITDVLHQAFVSVDENGTEAAAATGVVGGGLTIGGPPPPPSVVVNADHSFFFFIRDVSSGTILFVGREDDPTAQ